VARFAPALDVRAGGLGVVLAFWAAVGTGAADALSGQDLAEQTAVNEFIGIEAFRHADPGADDMRPEERALAGRFAGFLEAALGGGGAREAAAVEVRVWSEARGRFVVQASLEALGGRAGMGVVARTARAEVLAAADVGGMVV
jgi:hypothetical protein